ncbi:hypothetical protein LOTGIDRAFT_165633 [Lottia gigantea]|uniref:RWD domain-containing protein n=1 Tax=Lottia gigantea TaxID=225164 RepID=V3ZBT6_LOTGI|nr:hypothetical protein LOTGIDRAFT_165633 [Lottia gigantea]ESO88493.1 hypothetical protein LOTGIDRAFT_165633 [Lottia gigantea]
MEKEEEIDIKEMLELQLAEVEMLKSMFPQKGEFVLDDEYAVREIQAYVDGDILLDSPESRIGFTVHITTEKYPVELVVHLPHEYPAVYPETFLRTQNTTRESSRRLNDDLSECMQSLEKGEICVGTLIQWVQENVENYFTEVQIEKTEKSSDKIDTTFSRLWIYSHHIYSKFKRRDILDWAQELKLTGFSMPGKPGVMCVEGYSSIVEEFWYRIRRMNWKKIAVKEKEDFEIDPNEGIDKYKKFSDFQELSFDVQAGKAREYHMNLGKFFDYLVKHDSKHIFPLYFGVEGKSAPE